MDDRALVERQLGRPPRAFRRVARRCPFGAPAVTEQEPYDGAGEPFPTTYYLTCPHLVAAVSRLEAAGGVERWSAAVDEDDELAADLERVTVEQRALRRELAGGTVGATRARRSTSESAAAEIRAGSSASTRTSPTRWPDRATGSAIGFWPSSGRSGRARPAAPARLSSIARMSELEIANARREWEDGRRRLLDRVEDARERERLLEQVDVVTEELRRRVGGTFTLAELARAYAGADAWSREIVSRRAPAPGWPRTLSLVEAAAFELYSRGAIDYEP